MQRGAGVVGGTPGLLHAFAMAICRADGSSAEEAKLVADHLVLANLFGHDSHGVGMMPAYIQNTTTGRCVRNHHAKISRDNGAVVVVDGGAGYGQVVAKEAMDIGIERAQEARSLRRRARQRASHRSHKVAMGKVRVANNKRVQMDPGLLIDAVGQPTTEPGVMYNPPFGAILPFGLHKGGGLAVICDLLAGALTGGRTHSPRTIKKDGHNIINNMLSVIIDPAAMGSTELFEDEVETFINWVKSARPQAGVAEVLAPGEPERARRADREKNGVPIDTTTWQQLIEIARKVRLHDTEIPLATAAA